VPGAGAGAVCAIAAPENSANITAHMVEIVSFSFVAFLALAISGTFCTLM
jgi:hypothetical protein